MAQLKPLFDDIVDAIHEKDGLSDGIAAKDFPQRIRELPTGGGGGGSGTVIVPPSGMRAISVSTSDPEMGSVFGACAASDGAQVTVTATPNSLYALGAWKENGEEVARGNNYTFSVSGDRYLTAEFQDQYMAGRDWWKISSNRRIVGMGVDSSWKNVVFLLTAGSVYSYTASDKDIRETGSSISRNYIYGFSVRGSVYGIVEDGLLQRFEFSDVSPGSHMYSKTNISVYQDADLNEVTAFAEGNGVVVLASSNHVWVTPDMVNFTKISLSKSMQNATLQFDKDRFLLFNRIGGTSSNSVLYQSFDGFEWTSISVLYLRYAIVEDDGYLTVFDKNHYYEYDLDDNLVYTGNFPFGAVVNRILEIDGRLFFFTGSGLSTVYYTSTFEYNSKDATSFTINSDIMGGSDNDSLFFSYDDVYYLIPQSAASDIYYSTNKGPIWGNGE